MTAREADNIVEFYRPLNEDDDVQHTYSVKILEQTNVRRGVAWSSRILRGGNEVGTCWNDGDGGCNIYLFEVKEERELFESTARAAYKGVTQFEDEEEDIFIAWLEIKNTSYTAIKEI